MGADNHYNCIYMYTNIINGKRYVGQTINFNKRHREHIYVSYNDNCDLPFHSAIRKYGIENFQIDILVENINTQEERNELEKSFILLFDTLVTSRKGYNISSGGSNGNNFAGKSEEEMDEIRKKWKESRSGENHWFFGKKFSDEHKKKISESHKGKKMSEEARKNMSKSKKGKNKGGEHPTARKIIQLSKKGEIIKVWDCITSASKNLHISRTAIQNCLKGTTRTAGGFMWKYEE